MNCIRKLWEKLYKPVISNNWKFRQVNPYPDRLVTSSTSTYTRKVQGVVGLPLITLYGVPPTQYSIRCSNSDGPPTSYSIGCS